MKFLIDVNASGSVAQKLEDEGHDVVRGGDRDPRMTDDDILDWAMREHRIIVTTDQDVEEVIWREGRAHNGLLRLENLARAERIQLLDDALAYHREALEGGAIVIALNRKTRIRRPV